MTNYDSLKTVFLICAFAATLQITVSYLSNTITSNRNADYINSKLKLINQVNEGKLTDIQYKELINDLREFYGKE